MRLQRSKFPFLYEREFDWYIAPNGTGEEIPFTKVAINDALHDKTLIRDYFSIVLLEKHQDLFDKIDIKEILQHWRHFQKDQSYLVMNNYAESILIEYDSKNAEFFFDVYKEGAVACMFSVSEEDLKQTKGFTGDYYYSKMLSEQQYYDLKHKILRIFKVSYAIKHFAPTEVKIVHDKNRRVQMGKGKNNKVTADTNLLVHVNIIDSSYLTTIIHVDATNVRGHFRLQPHGLNNMDRKLIWINPYEKGANKRTAKKLEPDSEV